VIIRAVVLSRHHLHNYMKGIPLLLREDNTIDSTQSTASGNPAGLEAAVEAIHMAKTLQGWRANMRR
jgi:hypothetical protein